MVILCKIQVPRSKRSMKVKKCPNLDENDEEDNNGNNNAKLHRQNSSSCCSEDDSNASHEMNGVTSCSSSKGSGALNLNGKTRANRGSATDPQSLYARVINYIISFGVGIISTCGSSTHACIPDDILFLLNLVEKKRENQRETENLAEPCP